MYSRRSHSLPFLLILLGLTFFLYPRERQLKDLVRDPRTSAGGRREITAWLGGKEPLPPTLAESSIPRLQTAASVRKPTGTSALERAMRAYLDGNFQAAARSLDSLVARPDLPANALYRAIQIAFWMGDSGRALRFTTTFLERHGLPEDRSRMRFLARVCADYGSRTRAADLWEHLYRSSGDPADKREALDAVTDLDPSARAIALHQDYLDRFGDDPRLRERLARLYQFNRKVKEYVEQLELVLAKQPLRHELRKELLRATAALGLHDRFIEHFEALRRLGKEDGEFADLYLDALEETGRTDRLKLELRKRLAREPEDDRLLDRLAGIYERELQLEKAADLRARLFDLHRDVREPGIKAAAVYELVGRTEEALQIYRELHERFPDEGRWREKLALLHDPAYERDLAWNRLQQGDPAGALAAARHRLVHDPADPAMLRIAAEVLYQQRDIVVAREYYERAARADPRDAEALYMLSDCHARLGDQRASREAAERALSAAAAGPPSVRVQLARALALHHLGRSGEAEEILKDLFAREPDNAGVVSAYAWLLLDQKRTSEAAEFAARWRELAPESAEFQVFYGALLRAQGKPADALKVLRPRSGETTTPERMVELVEALLELGDWPEARRLLREQDWQDYRWSALQRRVEARYAPESAFSLSTFASEDDNRLRILEGFRTYMGPRLWIAEFAEWTRLDGNAGGVDILRGQLRLGLETASGVQAFVGGGVWENEGERHGRVGIGVDVILENWSFSVDADIRGPWDNLYEAGLFGGIEDRLVLGVSTIQGSWYASASFRYSNFTIGDGRGALTGAGFGRETAWFGRIELRLTGSERPTAGRGFFGKDLRYEEEWIPHLSLVGQLSFSDFHGDESNLAVIPLLEESRAQLVGAWGTWFPSETVALSMELLLGRDPPRGLEFGELYTGTVRAVVEFEKDVKLELSARFFSERLQTGGGDAWRFLASIHLNH